MRKPKPPPELPNLLEPGTVLRLDVMRKVTRPTVKGKYLHWDDVRHRQPPEGLSREEWWFGLKLHRTTQRQATPLLDASGKPFTFIMLSEAHALLHEMTQRASGTLGSPDQVTNPETRDRYLVRNLMEEGITSSLIEGAATTRAKAKELLRTQRKPRDQAERMVVNNYQAMQFIMSQGDRELSPELILDLHEILTRDTLDKPDAAGRFRLPGEQVDVVDTTTNEVLYIPPAAGQIPQRIERMCHFGNERQSEEFIHPVVRAILLHFWLAYEHPFVDGNGRVGRALFYWSMLRNDYWLCQYISISRVILQAPARYARVFLLTESDDNDLTYFIMHQLEVIKRSIDDLYGYIATRLDHRHELQRRLRLATDLNDRQLDIIDHALRHPGAQYDIRQHQTDQGVVYETARGDLLGLAEKGLMAARKKGRKLVFTAVPALEEELANMGSIRSRSTPFDAERQ